MAEIILRADHISRYYKDRDGGIFKAVDDVSFELRSGETLGIVGESGSGKSTIAKMLLGLLDVSEGSVFLEGSDFNNRKGNEKREIYRKIQMVFQDPAGSFDPRRTLGDGIGESLKNAGRSKREIRSRVVELLKKCGLSEEFADRYPYEISGGQCQRAAIARALAIEPEILVCDEATSALDVTVQQQVMQLLTELREEQHLSYIFICHNLALVQSFCDRILVMKDGKVVEQGRTDEVIANPKADYTKMLLEASL